MRNQRVWTDITFFHYFGRHNNYDRYNIPGQSIVDVGEIHQRLITNQKLLLSANFQQIIARIFTLILGV